MPVTGPLAHIDISVGHPERSIPFYAAFFAALGYRRWQISAADWQEPNPRRATWGVRYADGSRFAIELRPAWEGLRDIRYDRYRPGPHHMAFHAASYEVVDRAHEAMLSVGATVLDPPTDYSEQEGYGEGYYAAFFADPDAMKLEVAHIPAANP